jgi:hypothetical protein
MSLAYAAASGLQSTPLSNSTMPSQNGIHPPLPPPPAQSTAANPATSTPAGRTFAKPMAKAWQDLISNNMDMERRLKEEKELREANQVLIERTVTIVWYPGVRVFIILNVYSFLLLV